MTEIELKGGAACLYRDNDEKIDPDKDFSHIDKRIQDVLGQYQKDFMGEVSADNLGARWGGYGSFLPVDRNIPIPTHTRPQAHISSRSPRIPIEVRQNSTIQAIESVVPRPGIPPLSGKATAVSDKAVDVRSSSEAFLNSQPKAFSANDYDNNLLKVRLKVVTDKGIDNSAIYSGLGLDDSPSSPFGDSPLELDATSPYTKGLPERSPSYIIKVMTTFPVPAGKLLSPLPDNLLSLTFKEISLDRNFSQEIIKTERESISSEEKMNLLKEKKVKQINKNKVPEIERKNFEDPMSIIGQCSKRKEESRLSKGIEFNIDILATSVDMPVDRKESSNITYKDNVSSISFPFSERSNVGQSIDVGTKVQKQPHVRQGASIEQVDSLASPVISLEGKGNPHGSKEKVQRDKNGIPVVRNNELSQGGYIERNSNKSTESTIKKKVKEEFEDSFSSRDAGMQHDRMTQENTDKSTKQERKMKSKVKARLDVAVQEAAGTYHKRTIDRSVEKINNDRKAKAKANTTVEKDIEDKEKHGNEDSFQAVKDLGWAKAEPIMESSSEKKLPHSRIEANLSNRKERPSSGGKKKTRKSQDVGQLTTSLPKVSFRVGSSSVLSIQQADCRSNSMSQGETQRDVREEKGMSDDDVAGKATLKKKDISNHNVAGKAILRKKEKVTASKDSIVRVARREKDASGSKLKDKSEDKQSQYPSNVGSNPRQDLSSNSHLIEKPHSDVLPPATTPPVSIQDDWVQCDKCQTWRLLPHDIKPDNLPKRWLCTMQTWLLGMNKCSFTEEETRDALLALYRPQPLANGAQIQQPYPIGVPLVVTADTHLRSTSDSTIGLDALPGSGNRRPKEEVFVNSKKDQPCTSESGSKQKLSRSRTAFGKPVVIGKKREASRDRDVVHKKVKRDPHDSATGVEHTVPLATEIGNASLNHDPFPSEGSKDLLTRNSNVSRKLKDKIQKPAGTNEDERKDVSARKRTLKDWQIDPLGTETPSSHVPLEETSSDIRKLKRQKLKESYFTEKESSTSRANDKNSGGNSGKVGRQHRDRNMSQKTVDGKKSSGSGLELKMPALAAATSSSSKVSNTCRLKVKSQAKCSPVGSISSSSLKVSRSDHDRSRNQVSVPNAEQELPLVKKKNLEARIVVLDSVPHHEERTEGKSKREKDSGVQLRSVQEDVKKLSAVKHVDEHRKEKQLKLESYESKEKRTDFKEEEYSSPRKLSSTDLGPRSLNVMCLNKSKSDDILQERVKPKDQVGNSRDNPSSSTQELEFEKADRHNSVEARDSKGKLPKLPGCSDLMADDAGAPISARKEISDRAARTALKEATDLKHLADRLKVNKPVASSQVLFQASLKFLQWASLVESGNSEVYISTAKLCHYCAREFEKLNDMASAALAYKCEEVAYMRVVYAEDVAASRYRQELQSALTVPQVESPSSSASDVDNVNNPTPNDAVKSTHSSAVHGNYVISAGNRSSFVHLLDFARYVHLAMDAARNSQAAFAATRVTLGEAGNEEGISSIKRVIDFSFHDVDELLHLVRLAMEAFSPGD